MNSLRSFGFILRDVSRLYVRRFEQRAAALDLTLPQCRALVYLALHEGLSQARLAELTDVEPMTLVRILDRMQSDGWLERRIDVADRRARNIHLKAKAKHLVDEIWKLADLTREEAFRAIPRKQVGVLIKSLDQIRNNLAMLEPLATSASPSPSSSRAGRGTGTRPRRERSRAQS
ncbi:MAG TPA: MarR family transcriptional regulator [Steroidobacteraceae bacterium]|nr:MarR family transcriptional regulator [Steroidobacteraceae bacterium]